MAYQPGALASKRRPMNARELDAGRVRDNLGDHAAADGPPPTVNPDQDADEVEIVGRQSVMQQAKHSNRIIRHGGNTEM